MADSAELRQGRLLYAVETQYYDGPWVIPEGFGKLNGILKYTLGDADRGLSLTGTGYLASWMSTDQVPLRAVEREIIQHQILWAKKVRTYFGIRQNFFHFDVSSLGLPANSGEDDAQIFTPRASLILGLAGAGPFAG